MKPITTQIIAAQTGIDLPDSGLVETAITRAAEESVPMLFHHVMRCALFARLFSAASSRANDMEVMALSAILHDIGSTDHRCSEPGRFEIRSANAARRLVLEGGMSEARSRLIWDTIALHPLDLNLHRQEEAWAVQMGILADVTGAGLDLIDAKSVRAILALFPRLDFKRGFMDILRRESRKADALPAFHPTIMIRHHEGADPDIPNARDIVMAAPFES